MQKKDLSLTLVPTDEADTADKNVRNFFAAFRLDAEMKRMVMEYDPSASAFPIGDNYFKWHGTIEGPPNTVYAGHKYYLSLEFSEIAYPYRAPVIKFITPVFHPNVDTNGAIDLDILTNKWSSDYDVCTILRRIQALLGQPNIESPLNVHAAQLWQDQEQYKAYLDAFYEQNSVV